MSGELSLRNAVQSIVALITYEALAMRWMPFGPSGPTLLSIIRMITIIGTPEVVSGFSMNALQ